MQTMNGLLLAILILAVLLLLMRLFGKHLPESMRKSCTGGG